MDRSRVARKCSSAQAALVRISMRMPTMPMWHLFLRTVFSSASVCRQSRLAFAMNREGGTGPRFLRGTLEEPQRGGLLPVQVKHRRLLAAVGKIAGNIDRQRGLAAAAFRVCNQNRLHFIHAPLEYWRRLTCCSHATVRSGQSAAGFADSG